MAKALVIVESPTKAKTISRFLGKDFQVEASFGHVRDLPKSKMGVDVEHNFLPEYVVGDDDKETVTKLKKLAKATGKVYFATDEDREGEAISWHLAEVLKIPDQDVQRIVFHEITKEAISHALANPRPLDIKRVDAQQARRILDRLVGYELSPFLWRKVRRGLSAGRVQSVAVRLIVEREREILAFKNQEYWTIEGVFDTGKETFEAKLLKLAGSSLDKFAIGNQKTADELLAKLKGAAYHIGDVQLKTTKRSPAPPFTTATLQMDANRRLSLSANRTMRLAQQLYEGVHLGGKGQTGLITYMRTDSLNLSEKFIHDAKAYLEKTFGKDYTLPAGRTFKTSSKGAQEAHEAIRPTEASHSPESIREHLDPDQLKLYELIWNRAMASQMPEAQIDQTSVDVNANVEQAIFRATGAIIRFPGFLKVYPDGAKENLLPPLKVGDTVQANEVKGVQHFTEPPPRYSDASIIKVLEEHGIGRPSTYAPTITTVVDRGYVERLDRRLKPTEVAFLVIDLLVKHFPEIVDYKFTANMEQQFDDIAEGKTKWQPVLKTFYDKFHTNLVAKDAEISKKDLTETATDEICEKCGKPMIKKFGRFGTFLACTGYPDCKHTINLDKAGNHAPIPEAKPMGIDPISGLGVFLKTGRFGTYVQLGEKKKEEEVGGKKKRRKKGDPVAEKLKSASLLTGMDGATLTLEQALQLLSLPRVVGKTAAGEDILAANGKFGPYIKAGINTRSIPDGESPLTITIEKSLELLAQPKQASRRSGGRTLKELGAHPKTGKNVKVLDGKYGPYVSDGKTHASLPKGTPPESVTIEQAVELMAEREGRPKKRKRGKK
ncbi:MAG: type I DNA topoisomerase [Patescibacteria group bacterium]